MFQGAFFPDDPHDAIIDFDAVDNRADVGFTKRDVAGGSILTHGTTETFDSLGIESWHRHSMSLDAVQRGFGAVTVELQTRESVFQKVVEGFRQKQ